MNLQADEITDEDATDEMDVSEPEVDQDDGEAVEAAEPETDDEAEADPEVEEEDDGELVLMIDGEAPAPSEDDETAAAPDWVRELRKQNREEKKRNRELQKELEALKGAGKPAELGKKPTLEDSDYDAEAYEAKLATWFEQKRKHDEAEAKQREAQEAASREWTQKLQDYESRKKALKVRDFEDAEETVTGILNVQQQGMILQGSDSPEKIIYALGQKPELAQKLAAITDPVKFSFAAAKLENSLKFEKRKPTKTPEKTVTGSGRSSSMDNQLEKLREEADRTGNRTKLHQYMRQKKLRAS